MLQKNSDFFVWFNDIVRWVSRPPGVYFIIMAGLGVALLYSWSRPTAVVTRQPVQQTSSPPAPPQPNQQQKKLTVDELNKLDELVRKHLHLRRNCEIAGDVWIDRLGRCVAPLPSQQQYVPPNQNQNRQKPVDSRCEIAGDVWIESMQRCVAPLR